MKYLFRELYGWSMDTVMYFRVVLFAFYTLSQVITFPVLVKVKQTPVFFLFLMYMHFVSLTFLGMINY